MNKNTTGRRGLDQLGADPRVWIIYQDLDGIWCDLVDGFQNGTDPGNHTIHENTIRAVVAAAASITPCACEVCTKGKGNQPVR